MLGLQTGPVCHKLQRLLRRDQALTFQDVLKEAGFLDRELQSPLAKGQAHSIRTRVDRPGARSEQTSVDLDELRESLKSELWTELTAQLTTLSS